MPGCNADEEPAKVGEIQSGLVMCGTVTGTCAPGYTMEDDGTAIECEQQAPTGCPTGYTGYVVDYNGGAYDYCTSPSPVPVLNKPCPSGYVYEIDWGSDHCIANETWPTCPSGYLYRSGRCTYASACCGDGLCDLKFETDSNCPADCGPGVPLCDNDGLCEGNENQQNCPNDCTHVDSCAQLPACPSGTTRMYVLYTQDMLAVCNTHHACNGGSTGCRTGNKWDVSLLGFCTSQSSSQIHQWCPSAISIDPYTAYTGCQ
jgi:hypothetical protein